MCQLMYPTGRSFYLHCRSQVSSLWDGMPMFAHHCCVRAEHGCIPKSAYSTGESCGRLPHWRADRLVERMRQLARAGCALVKSDNMCVSLYSTSEPFDPHYSSPADSHQD